MPRIHIRHARRTAGSPVDEPEQLSREERWERAGVKVLHMPENVAIITGPGYIEVPSRGDRVDLLIDTGKNSGCKSSGFVVVDGLQPGEPGGPYEDTYVFRVVKAADYERSKEGRIIGPEWPADCLRLSK